MDRNLPLGRRAVLRGAGVAIALPALPSLWPTRAHAVIEAPRRLLVFYTANGLPFQNHATRADAWFPTAAPDGGWTPSPILEPLASLAADVSVIKGVANRPAHLEPGGHPSGTAGFLTCAQVKTSPTRSVGVSMDQVVANVTGRHTKLASLVAGIPTEHTCSVLPCVFRENISWVTPEQPAPRLTDPMAAFNLLFGDVRDPATSTKARAERLARRKSVLDTVNKQANRLADQLGTRDRQKLDQYLTAVRETEMRTSALLAAAATGQTCSATSPAGGPATAVWRDIFLRAFECDATRVITFMLTDSQSQDGEFHSMSHAPGKYYDRLLEIARGQVFAFADLIRDLKDMVDVDGKRVLDNTLAFFSNEIADGNNHDQVNRPVLLAGSLGGRFPTGKLIDPGREIRQSDLFLTMMQGFGVNLSSFGADGKAIVPELMKA